MIDPDGAATQARELIAWADAYQDTNEAGARRIRAFCNDVLELLDELDAERSARIAMQANYERALAILGKHADQALAEAHDEVPF